MDANLQVVVAFRIFPKAVWQMPKYGTFNLHASLLPHYRGAAPINWAIINREEKTGVTTFFIDEQIDTGSIIANREVTIESNETAGSLHDKLMVVGSELVLETLELIENGNADPKSQAKDEDLREAPKLNPENTRVDWTKPGKEIDAFIRGLSPYPVAWTILENNTKLLKTKIYKAHFEKSKHNFTQGSLQISKKEAKVACLDGFIVIEEIQLPGKRKMDIFSLLNGYTFGEEAKLS